MYEYVYACVQDNRISIRTYIHTYIQNFDLVKWKSMTGMSETHSQRHFYKPRDFIYTFVSARFRSLVRRLHYQSR